MDVKGNTAFMMAAWSGHLHILEWLFASFGLVAALACDLEGNGPLHLAAWAPHLGVMEWLIRHCRLTPGMPNRLGHTPLDVAARRGHWEAFELLLRLGAALCRPLSQATLELLPAKPGGFEGYLLIGSPGMRSQPQFQNCIFTAAQLRRALLAGTAVVHPFVLRELVADVLDHRGAGAALKLEPTCRRALESIRDERLFLLRPSSSLLNLALNFLNTTAEGRLGLHEHLKRTGLKLGQGLALPPDLEELLDREELTAETELRLRFRALERQKEAEKERVYGGNLRPHGSASHSSGTASTESERCVVS
jgi:hypothetical protein